MKAATVATTAAWVADMYRDARDIAVSNLTMSGVDDEEDNVVILVMTGQRGHVHVIGADDGSLAYGVDRQQVQTAIGQRYSFRDATWLNAADVFNRERVPS